MGAWLNIISHKPMRINPKRRYRNDMRRIRKARRGYVLWGAPQQPQSKHKRMLAEYRTAQILKAKRERDAAAKRTKRKLAKAGVPA